MGPSLAAGAPGRGRESTNLAEIACHRAATAAVRGRAVCGAMRPSTPAQVHQTAPPGARAPPKVVSPIKAMKKGKAGVQGACAFGFGRLVAPVWRGRPVRLWGQNAGRHTRMFGVWLRRSARSCCWVAPAPCSSTGRFNGGERWCSAAPRHQPACSSSSSPRWPPGQIDGAYLLTTRTTASHVNRQQFIASWPAALKQSTATSNPAGPACRTVSESSSVPKLKSGKPKKSCPWIFTFVKLRKPGVVERISRLAAA